MTYPGDDQFYDPDRVELLGDGGLPLPDLRLREGAIIVGQALNGPGESVTVGDVEICPADQPSVEEAYVRAAAVEVGRRVTTWVSQRHGVEPTEGLEISTALELGSLDETLDGIAEENEARAAAINDALAEAGIRSLRRWLLFRRHHVAAADFSPASVTSRWVQTRTFVHRPDATPAEIGGHAQNVALFTLFALPTAQKRLLAGRLSSRR